jgi:heat shock protein beta-11
MVDVLFSSSFDDKYSPMNVLNDNKQAFWTSTGMYPQELILSLDHEKAVNSLNVVGYGIKKLVVESCENENSITSTFRQSELNEIPFKDGKIQDFNVEFSIKKPIKLIKFIILEGYDDFCSINSIALK